MPKNLLDRIFKDSIFLKGIDGVLEIVGGVLLLFIKPQTINRIITAITQHELLEDPNDIIANYVRHSVSNLSISKELFGAFYLLLHGLVKIIIIWALLKNKLWGYTAAFIFLGISIVYQTYRFSLNHSIGLVILTIFDIFLLWLAWREYEYLRNYKKGE